MNDYMLALALVYGMSAVMEFTLFKHKSVISGLVRSTKTATMGLLLFVGAFLILAGVAGLINWIFG